MASDPLSVDSILKHMADALPTHPKDDSTSDLSSSYEAIALFCHACMTSVGFRLLGFGEGQKMGELHSPAFCPAASDSISRVRVSKTHASITSTMELFVWLAYLPICAFPVFDAVCGQSGSIGWEG